MDKHNEIYIKTQGSLHTRKDMPDDILGLRGSIDSFNFAMSRNGKYMDVCQNCRDELWKWMESDKE